MFKKSRGLLVTLIVVAAVLPMVLVATMSEDLRLKTFADQGQELRLWVEPAEVVTKPGRSFMVTVYGEAKATEELVPQVKLALTAPEKIDIVPEQITFLHPFSGRVKLGEANLHVLAEGEFVVEIPEANVNTNLPNLKVITSGVKILSRK